jgi:hypothetical protein
MNNSYTEWLKNLQIGDKLFLPFKNPVGLERGYYLEISKIGRKWISTKYHGRYYKNDGQEEHGFRKIWQTAEHFEKHLKEIPEIREQKEQIKIKISIIDNLELLTKINDELGGILE